MSDEPDLAPGDSGDDVTALQERLTGLGYYDGRIDGQYGDTTETAVRRLQETVRQDQTGSVDETTWAAITDQETQAAQANQPQPADSATQPQTDQQQLSEDGQWSWDGSAWQPVTTAPTTTGDQQLSADGQWSWDGTAWQPVANDAATPDAATTAMQLSPDGQWQWDGTQWQPAGAQSAAQSPGSPGVTTASTDDSLTAFATGSADLTDEHRTVLARIADDLNAHPLHFGGFVTLTGSADRRGDAAANQELGRRRAEAVRDCLQQLITDDDTRQAIRAYSLGAPGDGPVTDDPSLRKVDIRITRRDPVIDVGPHATPQLPTPSTPDTTLPGLLNLPPQPIPQPDPAHPAFPDWFWRELPKRPADPSFVTQASDWLNELIDSHAIARIGGGIAGAFGLDRAKVTKALDDAFRSAGEAAVKEMIRQLIQHVAGPPGAAPSSPTGPAVNPVPFPSPQAQTPTLPTP